MSRTKPMKNARRLGNYVAQNGCADLTPRQVKRLRQKSRRAAR